MPVREAFGANIKRGPDFITILIFCAGAIINNCCKIYQNFFAFHQAFSQEAVGKKIKGEMRRKIPGGII
jgi:hypothetical protein